jgi:transcriptional accessory protein Tex/SPT6
VKVKVLEIDMSRKRISLTRKVNEGTSSASRGAPARDQGGKEQTSAKNNRPMPAPKNQEIRNNAFASLKDMKWR